MADHRFAELRPTVWMRPANLPVPPLDRDWIVVTAEPAGTPPRVLAGRLWALDELATAATDLLRRLDEADRTLRPDDPADIPPAFTLAAEALRFLRSEPLLPSSLTPADWPVDRLRGDYERFETRLQAMMAPFLRDRATAR
jgi:phenylacetic acid degradation operon negative regulatory protein